MNFATGSARVKLESDVDLGTLRAAVDKAGYTLVVPEPEPTPSTPTQHSLEGGWHDLRVLLRARQTCPAEAAGSGGRHGQLCDAHGHRNVVGRLELATIRMAVDAGVRTPDTLWLAVNLSPATLLDERAVGALEVDCGLVVEITEHSPLPTTRPCVPRSIGSRPPGRASRLLTSVAGHL